MEEVREAAARPLPIAPTLAASHKVGNATISPQETPK